MKQKSIGFKIGITLAMIHLILVVLAFLAMIKSHSSTAGLVFIWFYFLDAPLLLLLPASALKLFGVSAPLIQFGVFGSGMWFLIPWLIDIVSSRIFANGNRKVRIMIIAVTVPLILVGFFRLSFFSTKLLIQQERPEELKKMLNNASSDFLTGKVIFEDYAPGGISSISRMNCRPLVGTEVLIALPRGVVFLNDSYKEQYRLNLSDRKGFKSIEPLALDGSHSCGFLSYMFQEGSHLFDLNGKEIWRSTQQDSTAGSYAGVQFGDIDGDGRPEFALYHTYRNGIDLVDANGKTKWQHPIYALGHMEIANISQNGKATIIYSNSNNANGITEFTFLNSEGIISNQMKVSTMSSEFAVIQWPSRESEPHILLTEEGKLKLIDLKGDIIYQLDAPGCRTFGDVKAVTVKFKKEDQTYLAVKKGLHPDLSVLYVYDANGKLVYQKTQVVEGLLAPTLAAVPVGETGTEKLLVSEYARNFKAQVMEYSLTR